MKNKNFWVLTMPKYSMLVFVCFNIISMITYPGGSVNNKLPLNDINAQKGYSFFYNFFSDLGMTVSHSGDINLLSCFLFNFSLIVIGICFFMLFYKVGDVFIGNKWLSKIGTFCGMLSGLCFIGVALTPSNIFLQWHIIFAEWIFRFLFIGSFIYSILIFKTRNFDNKYAFSFILFAFMVLVYIYISQFYLGDVRLHPEDLAPHVISQKLIAFWILISIYLYSIGLSKYINLKIK